MENRILKTTFVTLALALTSCGQVNFTPKVVKVTGVSLYFHEMTIHVGETHSFTATVEPNNATNKDVTWSVSNSIVGSIVQQNAIFTALKPGNTTVIVSTKDGGFTDSCEVTVKAIPAKVIDHVVATSSVLVYNVDEYFDRNTLIFTAYYTDDYYGPEV